MSPPKILTIPQPTVAGGKAGKALVLSSAVAKTVVCYQYPATALENTALCRMLQEELIPAQPKPIHSVKSQLKFVSLHPSDVMHNYNYFLSVSG